MFPNIHDVIVILNIAYSVFIIILLIFLLPRIIYYCIVYIRHMLLINLNILKVILDLLSEIFFKYLEVILFIVSIVFRLIIFSTVVYLFILNKNNVFVVLI